MRRGPGLGAKARQQTMQQKLTTISTEQEAASVASMQQHLETFQQRLEEFAVKHKDKINKNPIFRAQFQKMCKSIGVDPLASNKGVWGKSLTQMADFYYELGIQSIEACLLTKPKNGGIISIVDLISAIRQKRSNVLRIAPKTAEQQQAQERNTNDITADDIKLALDKISILGNTYKVLNIGGIEMVLSVAVEFQTDHIEILTLARQGSVKTGPNQQPTIGCVDINTVVETKKWSEARTQRAINTLIQEGMCWVDNQAHKDDGSLPSLSNVKYYIPSLWLDHFHTLHEQPQQ